MSRSGDGIWLEPVRGGYPDPWLLTRPGPERLEAAETELDGAGAD